MHCVARHVRVAQDEAFEVSGEGGQGSLEVCPALRQGYARLTLAWIAGASPAERKV